jgi:hypothetical protein
LSRERPPPYAPDNPNQWAEDLSDYLTRVRSTIAFQDADDKAANDGIILWDTDGYPVVSKNNEFRQIVLADGYGFFYIGSNVTFTANTATALSYTANGQNAGLSISGSQITFDEAGKYLISFSAQISSTSSSTVNFAFWPRLNGSNVANSTMRNALHQNNAALVVSRTSLFTVSAGDYLEAMAAVDDASGKLEAIASSIASEPAAPSTTLSIVRISQ